MNLSKSGKDVDMCPLVTRKHRIFLLSNFKDYERRKLTCMIHALGGSVSELTDNFNATHLVVPYFRITPKMVAALAAGIWIVQTSYILRSYENGSWDLEASYEIGSSSYHYTIDDRDSSLEMWKEAPRQCRENALVKMKPNLAKWKVGLIADDPMELHTLKRILNAGGASVVILYSPSNISIDNNIQLINKNSIDIVVVSVSDSSSVTPFVSENFPCVTFDFINDTLCMDPPPDISKYDFQRCKKKGRFIFKVSSGGKTPSYSITEIKGFSGRTFSTELEASSSSEDQVMHLNGEDEFNISVNTPFGCPDYCKNSNLFLNLNISTNVDHGKKAMNSVNLSLSKMCDNKPDLGNFYKNKLCDTMTSDTLNRRTLKRECEYPDNPTRKRTVTSRYISPGKSKKNFSPQSNKISSYFPYVGDDKNRSKKLCNDSISNINNNVSNSLSVENEFCSKKSFISDVDVECDQRISESLNKLINSEEIIILSSDNETEDGLRPVCKTTSVKPLVFSDTKEFFRAHLERKEQQQMIPYGKDSISVQQISTGGTSYRRERPFVTEIIISSDEEDNGQAQASINSKYEVFDIDDDNDVYGEVLVNKHVVWADKKCSVNTDQEDNKSVLNRSSKSSERKTTRNYSINYANEFNEKNKLEIDKGSVNLNKSLSESTKGKKTACSDDCYVVYDSEVNTRTSPVKLTEDIDVISDSELPSPPCIPHVELSIDNLLSPLKDLMSNSPLKHLSPNLLQKDLPSNLSLSDVRPSSILKDYATSSPQMKLAKEFSQTKLVQESPLKKLPFSSVFKDVSSLNDVPSTFPLKDMQLKSYDLTSSFTVQIPNKNTNNNNNSISEKCNYKDDVIFKSVNENYGNNSPPSNSVKLKNFKLIEDNKEGDTSVKSADLKKISNEHQNNTVIPLSVVNHLSCNSLLEGTESGDIICNENYVNPIKNCEMICKAPFKSGSINNIIQYNSSDDDRGSKTSKALVLSAEKIFKTQADFYLSKLQRPYIELGAYSIPECVVHGSAECNLSHGKKRASLELEHHDENLLSDAVCPTSAIELLQGRIDFEIYPSFCFVQHALLCTMDRWNEIGIDALLCLQCLLRVHPPCANGMLDYYKKIFFASVTDVNAGASDGVFWYCLTKLEQALNFSDRPQRSSTCNPAPLKEECLDSIIFPAVNRTNRESPENSNSERLDQLFNCLDYFNDVIEADLSVGLLKNLSNPKRYICKNGKPLIAVALWGRNTVGSITVKCKHIMKLYLYCFKQCSNKMYSLSFNRLMNSMAQVIYASERNSSPPMYPNIGSNCRDLASTFSTLIMENDLNMVEVSTLLHSLRPDWFRLCVCLSLIEKLYGRNIDIALQPMAALLKDLWALNQEFPHPECNLSLLQNNGESVVMGNTDEISQLRLKKALKKDKKGETRLHITCRCNRYPEVEELLKVPYINVNEKDNAGFTPLHEASLHGSFECVQLLLNHHTPSGGPAVDPRAKTSDGVTPLMDAVKRNHVKIASMLLEYGGQDLLLDKDEKGNSAWDLAYTNEMKNVFKNAPETSKCSALATVPTTLRLKLAILVPEMILFYLKYSEVRRIACELQNDDCDDNTMNSLVPVKFSPLRFKQDYKDFKILRSVVKKMLHSKVNLVDRLIFVL